MRDVDRLAIAHRAAWTTMIRAQPMPLGRLRKQEGKAMAGTRLGAPLIVRVDLAHHLRVEKSASAWAVIIDQAQEANVAIAHDDALAHRIERRLLLRGDRAQLVNVGAAESITVTGESRARSSLHRRE